MDEPQNAEHAKRWEQHALGAVRTGSERGEGVGL